MRATVNTALNQRSDLSGNSLIGHRAENSSSSIADTAAKFRQDDASQSLADSVKQRAQEDPGAFRHALQQAFGDKASTAELDALASMASSGNLPMPQNVKFVDAGTLGPNAMGAYDSTNGGTIYLDSRLLKDGQALEAVYTEELGHHLDAELGGQDAAGDEGAIFAKSLLQGNVGVSELKALKAEDDSGFINIDGKRIAVEFFGYSGPGSSESTGGSNSSSSSSSGSSSSYSGPGSSAGTGGSSSSSSSSGGSSSYSGPGSSAGTGGSSRSSSSSSSSSSSYSGPGSSVGTGGSDNSSSSSNRTSSYSGPGSSVGAGGSDNSSSSSNRTSSYSGPGSSVGAGGTDNASSPPTRTPSYSGPGSSVATGSYTPAPFGSTFAYHGPGSSIATGGTATHTPPEEDEDEPSVDFSFNLPGTQDLFERNTLSGGNRQAHRQDFVYSPTAGTFVRQYESNQFAPNENTIRINGGTSDEFRYNNSDSQMHDNNRNVQIGESVSTTGFAGYQEQVTAGDENLGASAEFNAGARGTGTAGFTVDRNGLDLTGGLEGFVGVESSAEAHAQYGPASGAVSAEAQAGLLGSANAGLSLDPRNGISGQLGVGAFAGAQVQLEASGELGDSVDAAAGVDLKAGVGFEASAEVDFGLDNVGVDLELGAALGLGADLKIDVSISPTGVIDDAGDVFDAVTGFFGR